MRISDIEFVLAIDTDARKVGRDLAEAIFAPPNCTDRVPARHPADRRHGADGPGARRHGRAHGRSRRARLRPRRRARGERGRDRRRAQGDAAPRCWSTTCRSARRKRPASTWNARSRPGVAVVNCMPVFIASDPALGAALPRQEAADRRRRHQGAARRDHRPPRALQPVPRSAASSVEPHLPAQHRRQYRLHEHARPRAGWRRRRNRRPRRCSRPWPSRSAPTTSISGRRDYIPWLNDNKLCFLQDRGRAVRRRADEPRAAPLGRGQPQFSARVVVDAIRCCKVALDRGVGGVADRPVAPSSASIRRSSSATTSPPS